MNKVSHVQEDRGMKSNNTWQYELCACVLGCPLILCGWLRTIASCDQFMEGMLRLYTGRLVSRVT